MNQVQATPSAHIPNHVPATARVLRAGGAFVILAWGTWGLLTDDLLLPTKRGVLHLHGLAAWTMAAAMACAPCRR